MIDERRVGRALISRRTMLALGGALAASAGAFTLAPSRALAEGATLARIKQEKKIVIGIFNGPPWGYRDADGKTTGEGPEILLAALRPIGVERLESVVTEFAGLIPGLAAGRFDAVASGLYINPARCKVVAFGQPDLRIADAVIVKKGNPKQLHSYEDMAKSDAKIGFMRGATMGLYVTAAGVPSDRVVLFTDNASALAGLQADRVDAFISTSPQINAALKTANDPQLERASPFADWHDPAGHEIFGYPAQAFRPDDADLRDVYNQGLKSIRASGELVSIIGKFGFEASDLPPENFSIEPLCAAS